MNKKNDQTKALDHAMSLYAAGHDNKYITLQLAEDGVEDHIIDEVIIEISGIRKSQRRKGGYKLVIYGASFIAAALVFTFISTKEGSPVVDNLLGRAQAGVLVMVEGISAVLGG